MYKVGMFILMVLCMQASEAKVVKGKIKDAQTNEEIVGAVVRLKSDCAVCTVSGLDGSFILSIGDENDTYLCCSSIGYQAVELPVGSGNEPLVILMQSSDKQLNEVTVTASVCGNTEVKAREIEKNSLGVVNVMSAKAIELSPDLTVGNVIRRMSGVTMERSESGEGQYAILRGMDKRYNYTLVNGVKIPAPDNKNRFVPLDIFPAGMLDRLEVAKSLTADMEGDGIGGAVDLVMKDAPYRRQLQADFSMGYNSRYFSRNFYRFDARSIEHDSPLERFGKNHRLSVSDFGTDNLRITSGKPIPNLAGSLTYGDRFLSDRLGMMAAVSVQNDYCGKSSDLYYTERKGVTESVTERIYNEMSTRVGSHLKLDWHPGKKHRLTWYNGYMYLRSSQVRDAKEARAEAFRMKLNTQGIFNSTLSGTHFFLPDDVLRADWKAVYGKATNRTPDNTTVSLNTTSDGTQYVSVNSALTRRWEHNSDRDLAAYVDLTYNLLRNRSNRKAELKAGGMYRDKNRGSFFNEYVFGSRRDQKADDGKRFDELAFIYKARNISDPQNYDAYERIGAAYVMAHVSAGRWDANAGLRVEHTEQGYNLAYPTNGWRNEGNQTYTDWMPSFHLKYNLHRNAYLHFSYCEAINRPGFFEIVPYHVLNEDYAEVGNPDLKHTVAHNFDLRYELFPSATEQLMVGAFYKFIQDPIEYGLQRNSGQDVYIGPQNYGDARNMGVEVDLMKSFRWISVKGNYTFTYSRMTTEKSCFDVTTGTTSRCEQSRPLYGQSAHAANLTLLLNGGKSGWNAQVAGGYTGKHIAALSQYYDDDIWEAGRFTLDVSADKAFGTHFTVFVKGSNLLNTPVIRYYHANAQKDTFKEGWRQHDGGIMEREETYGASFQIGVRYKL